MRFDNLLYDRQQHISIITLNRPERMNAISIKLMSELGSLLNIIIGDDNIGALIITGSKKFFAAGADIGEVRNLSSASEIRSFVSNAQSVFKKISELPVPVIAAVSGLALGGGCELCLACDIRIAADNALFGLPEVKLGLLPGCGGTQRLPRLVGEGRAKEILFSGEPIGAQEAHRIGLVNKVVPLDVLLDEAKIMAEKFVNQPSFALGTIKELVNDGLNMDLHSALVHEARCFEILFSTEDQKEGVNAFLEKRKPIFKGR